jgi:hypothetical protein
VKEYLSDIIDILDAAEKHGKIVIENFPNNAWNSKITTSNLIKDMEENYLINIERCEDSSFKGITLRTLRNETVTKTTLSQAKDQGVPPSVAYIVGSARRIAQELDI